MAQTKTWTELVSGLDTDYTSSDGKIKLFTLKNTCYGGEVIVKQILAQGQEEIYRREREGEIAKSNKHPNIVEVLENKTEIAPDGISYVYVIMRKYPSNLLQDSERRNKVRATEFHTEEKLWKMLKELISALAFLQQKVSNIQDYAHRDIKPQNILLDACGTIKICDFGFARKVEMTAAQAYTVAGTEAFFSPALRRAFIKGEGKMEKVQHNVYKSDVYSLGLTMLYLTILDIPEWATDLKNQQFRIGETIDEIEEYSPAWKNVLRRMLIVNEDARPDFLQLREEVETSSVPVQIDLGPQVTYADDDDEAFVVQPPPEQEGDPLQVTVKCGVSVVGIGPLNKAEVACMVTLKATNEGMDARRSNADIVCVIDVSGSMAGAKIQCVKNILNTVVQVLGPNDRVSIVPFNENSKRLCDLTPCDLPGKRELQKVIELLNASGNTNIAKGLIEGIRVISGRTSVNHVGAILLFSDGEDNKGDDPVSLCTQAVQQLDGDRSLSVHTFGYGGEINSSLLQSLAIEGKGQFHYLSEVHQIQEAFALTLGSVFSTVARNITVKLSRGESPVVCSISKVYSKDGENVFTLPGVTAGQTKELVFMISSEYQEIQGPVTACPISAKIEYMDNSDITTERTVGMEVRFVPWEEGKNPVRDPSVYASLGRVKGAEALNIARKFADEGNTPEAFNTLSHAVEHIIDSCPGDNPIIQRIVEDLQHAQQLVLGKNDWLTQGTAKFASIAYSHYTQNAVSGGARLYETKPQERMKGEMEPKPVGYS